MLRNKHINRDLARASLARLSCAWMGLRAIRAAGPLALAAIAAVMVPALPNHAAAQSQFDLSSPKADSGPPMLLQADQMIYDNQNNRVIARGNVEIYYNNYTLLADKVIYERGNNILKAEGNVRIKEPNGALISTNRITLTDDFRDGFIQSLKIVTQENVRISAARAIREKGDTTVFERAVFTPCLPCKEHPEKAPTWRIKAQKIIHKKSEATIEYRNAMFEMFGIPVLPLPYFKHADPTVKRKSGFLIPTYGSSDELGTMVETPYYFALAPNYDFTFTPLFTSERGVLLKGSWRHRLRNGRYQIKLAGVQQKGTDGALTSSAEDLHNGDFRGSIETNGKFNINQYWSWGWDITAESDDTFRRFYKIDSTLITDRVSQVNLTGQRGRNYFDTRIYSFGGLLNDDTAASSSRVHPVIDYNYIFSDPVFGGELALDTNVVSITRNDGIDSSRLITEMKWRKQLIDKRGQIVTPFINARGDLYHVSNAFIDPVTGMAFKGGGTARGMVAGGLEYRYPFIQHTANAAHILEPIAQIIARPNTTNQTNVPNQDANSLIFDDTLLFDIDKFSGYDRIEGGTRANVGLRYTLQRYSGGYVRAVVGQSYQVAGENEFMADTGLEHGRSDYVTGLYIQPMQYFRFIGQARFDKDDLNLKRTDLSASMNYGPASGSLIYANIDPQPALGVTTQREEIQASGNLRLAKKWWLLGSARYDIAGEQRINDSVAIKYADDCFSLTVTYTESFIRDRDIKPSESIMVNFQFKYLGAYSYGTDLNFDEDS